MISNTPLSKKANRVWSTTTAPAIEPVTLEEVKLFGRIDGTEEDDLLTSLIISVRENMELYLRRSLIEQTITMYMDYWPGNVVQLPRPPLISITSVSLLDESDVETDYDSDNYYTMLTAVPGELIIKSDASIPTNTSNRERGGYKIIFKAGYGDTTNNIPSPIRNGIKEWVIDAYENRVVSDLPSDRIMRKLSPFRVNLYAFSR